MVDIGNSQRGEKGKPCVSFLAAQSAILMLLCYGSLQIMMTSVPVVQITTYFSYFASKTKASIPAASGAADEVPLNTSVHL